MLKLAQKGRPKVVFSTPTVAKVAGITPRIYHTQIKKVKATLLPNELSMNYGPIEIKVSLGPGSFHSPPLYFLLSLVFYSMDMNTGLWSSLHYPQAWTGN